MADTFIHISAEGYNCQSCCTNFFGAVLSIIPMIIAVLIEILVVHLTNNGVYWNFNRISCGRRDSNVLQELLSDSF